MCVIGWGYGQMVCLRMGINPSGAPHQGVKDQNILCLNTVTDNLWLVINASPNLFTFYIYIALFLCLLCNAPKGAVIPQKNSQYLMVWMTCIAHIYDTYTICFLFYYLKIMYYRWCPCLSSFCGTTTAAALAKTEIITLSSEGLRL